ncbi:hypothetical protein [Pseudomonas fluorescens]|uniref:hypothetical protein n=1 Tax=Pseudomonas fluorescens TaxID=294 RepID=UPI00259BC6F2|nr:hypothetical protein [Pseudomonas fluorescens]WJK10964.1 hypothetical protein QR290_06380 [Pseudomonas fluorescens]
MPITEEEILDAMSALSRPEVINLITALEERFGVTAIAKPQLVRSALLTDAPSEIVTLAEDNKKDSVP